MANTVTIQKVLDWSRTFVRSLPLDGVGGFTNEPALSIANNVQQTLMGPPFKWQWNRDDALTAPTVAGTQDYTITTTTFGWLEHATITTGGDTFELEVELSLPDETKQDRPHSICVLKETSSAIVVRIFPAPDAVYTLNLVNQKRATIMSALSGTWDIPDHLAYLYRQGFLAAAFKMANDERGIQEYGLFVQLATAAAQGFAQQDDDLFIKPGSFTAQQVAALLQQQGGR